MSAELLIPPLLNSLVANRVWYDATPDEGSTKDAGGKMMPFILLSVMGGQDQEYVEQTMGPMTNIRLQITAYHPSTAGVRPLMEAARDRLLASAYSVGVLGSPVAVYDPARKLRGRFQQFSVWLPQ
jgi:hypothetical protein